MKLSKLSQIDQKRFQYLDRDFDRLLAALATGQRSQPSCKICGRIGVDMAHSKSPEGLHQFVQAWLKDQPGISKKQRDELAKRGAAELKALAEELMQEAERREKEPKVTNTP